MARTKRHDELQAARPFPVPSAETRANASLRRVPPQNQRDVQIMASDAKRDEAARVIGTIVEAYHMKPVRSNKELNERVEQYFKFCVERRIIPTVEGMALYTGYTRSTWWDWRSGRNKGFSDMESGFTTSDIVQKSVEMLACFDATLVMGGAFNPISYIHRAANYYGLQQRQVVTFENTDNIMREALSPEEIAKNLPDISDLEMEDNYA